MVTTFECKSQCKRNAITITDQEPMASRKGSSMRTYRSYGIEHRSEKHVAKPLDGDNLKIVSAYLPRVQEAIDTFGTCSLRFPPPPLR